ncbi:MAG: RNA polymerase alpha subunit C-terminal domain-containing protein [Bacteroidota bacterium]
MVREKTLRTCEKGHAYYKSTDCPTCPVCEQERKPNVSFLTKLSAPARRAMEHHGISTLEKLSTFSEKEIRAFHGVGPSTIPVLKQELQLKGFDFKNTQ